MPSSRTVSANGIDIFLVEQGQGPLVILCHGWPEIAFSWRHQIKALAAAGIRVIAPDQRGYGATDRPEPGGPVKSQAWVIAAGLSAARRSSATAAGWPTTSSQTLTARPPDRRAHASAWPACILPAAPTWGTAGFLRGIG